MSRNLLDKIAEMTMKKNGHTKEVRFATDIWVRFRSRTLTGKDYDVLVWWVFGLLVTPGMLAGFILDSECAVSDWSLRLAYVWVAPVLVIFFGVLTYCWERRGASTYTKVWAFVAPILIGLIATWLTIGYFDFANALTGSKETVLVSGPVIEKKSGYTRATGHDHYLTVDFHGQKVCLSVSKAEAEFHNTGQIYSRWMTRGGYGYFYTWKALAYFK